MLVSVMLLSVATAFECLRYECSSLSQGVCAMIGPDSTVLLNRAGCTADSQCDYLVLYEWASDSDLGDLFECHSTDESEWFFDMLDDFEDLPEKTLEESINTPEDEVEASYMDCRERDILDQYPNTLQMCETDSDCTKLNGSRGTCSCGLDGSKYCIVEMDSSAFDAYWNICASLDGKIDEITAKLWYWHSLLYVQIKTNPDCGPGIFQDLSYTEELSHQLSFGTLALVPALAYILL